jgi:type IV pilus assembly protein PilV
MQAPLQRGVGLIEVLIALVVLAVGALAIISMQITGKQANYDAVQRTTASQLASDLVERIRSNPLGSGGYLTGALIGGGTLAAPDPSCVDGDSCAPAELATADLYDWELQLDGQTETRTVGGTTTQTGGLVEPRACLTGPFGGGTGMYQLALAWRGTQPVSSTALGNDFCGGALDGTNLYGSDADPSSDEYRRVVLVTFYVAV